jgi:hypothetical protein
MTVSNDGEKNIEVSEFFENFYKFLDDLHDSCGDEKYQLLIKSVKLIFLQRKSQS